MTTDQETVLLIKGAISELTEEQRDAVMEFHAEIKRAVMANPMLGMAVALLGAELAATI